LFNIKQYDISLVNTRLATASFNKVTSWHIME